MQGNMQTFYSPDVYVQNVETINKVSGTSTYTAAFAGVAQRGPVGEAVLITSWDRYMNTFARGMSTAFIADSYLAFSVYGFFQNGGKRCYIIRTASSTAMKAVATLATEDTAMITAKDEGVWGNSLTLKVETSTVDASLRTFTVMYNGNIVEKYSNRSDEENTDAYWVDSINSQSNYINVVAGIISSGDNIAFTGGVDGTADLTDADYIGSETVTGSIHAIDTIDDVDLVAIPGRTSSVVMDGLLQYCESRKYLFAILDGAETMTASEAVTLRSQFNSKYGALYYPWGVITDPLSRAGKTRNCPTCGHVAGMIARLFEASGPWRAPAGTAAFLNGFVDTVHSVTNNEMDELNPNNVNCIVSKPNYGIVVWGARNLSKDAILPYISDSLLEMYVKHSIYNLLLQYVFSPNIERTWTEITANIEAFLHPLWEQGAFKGSEPEQAFYVKCDEDLNTDETVQQGMIFCEVGYAGVKPAEFIIIRFSHQVIS